MAAKSAERIIKKGKARILPTTILVKILKNIICVRREELKLDRHDRVTKNRSHFEQTEFVSKVTPVLLSFCDNIIQRAFVRCSKRQLYEASYRQNSCYENLCSEI
ncbi:hypothetical protein CEXT_86001 [Caerostris extrusa]|uniref:Uncharacterized protein n=1 Tax=Caerostris extrusa TaxID=172846 RepID=A0AAV4Y4D9_CAEEX|nr:hypothetical protein CEXT_86001 [Caerostris extrusa]